MKTELAPEDVKRLRAIVELGHELERAWPEPAAAARLAQLQQLIAACAEAGSPDLQRLAFHVRNLTSEMTARHLAAILVPFERLLGRASRDDDFLVSTTDAPERLAVPAPAIAIADNLRSAFNVGAIMRTSEAFGFTGVWLTGYTPTPDQEKTARTSLGAEEAIPWRTLPRVHDAIARAKAEGYTVVALETAANSVSLDDFVWPERAAIVVGNERFGLEHEVLAEVDHVVRIPLHGRKNSLNVGIAFGIAASRYREALARPKTLALEPIGTFRCGQRHPYEARRQGALEDNTGTIELEAGRQFEQALEDLAGFSRIWLIYQFDRNTNWKPKTLPPRGPRVKRGVFATRSPYRPNPLGLSAVELVSVEGRKLTVRGSDLLDGTPILDIKPYLPYADAFPEAKAGWTDGLDREAHEVNFTKRAQEQLDWLAARSVDQFAGFVRAQLEFDPLDDERKRVVPLGGNRYRLSYRTWRADFAIDPESRRITIEEILSGYSGADLEPGSADPYGDKTLHREFRALN